MSNDFTLTEQLIRYIDNELPVAEAAQLEAQLISGNENMQQELQSLQLAKAAIQSLGLRQEVKGIRTQMLNEESRPPARRLFIKRTLLVAASLVALLLVAGIYEYAVVSSTGLYTEKYSAYELPVTRGDENTGNIQQAYRNKQYDLAWSLYNNNPGNATAADCFFTGQSLLAQQQVQQAIPVFEQVLTINASHPLPSYQDDAEYYLALSYLHQKQYDKAIALLERIHTQTSHLYHQKVSGLFLQKVKLLRFKAG